MLLRLDELVEANQRLVEANERLEGRVAELERRLNRSSRNSSLPPSQDPPSAPPRPRGKESGGKRGGQHGHEGRYCRLLPPEQIDEIVEHWPERCGSCAHEFAETDRLDPTEPSRRQVAELPPIAVRVTEHRLHRVCCPECATVTVAKAPAGSQWAFGPRLQAGVVTLAVRNRVSRRDTTELARELFGVELATGSVDAIVQRAGEALAAPHTRLEQEITLPGRQHRRDRLASAACSGARSPTAHRCSGSRPANTPPRHKPSSVSATPGSSAPTAGPATTTSTRPGVSPAGHTCFATSPPTAKDGAVIYRSSRSAPNPNKANAASKGSSPPRTCRLRKQSLLAYLTEVITAHARDDPIPALS